MKKDWAADPQSFGSLIAWLEGGPDKGAEGSAYVAMHARLAAYFTRKGCRAPEELADETLSRVARRLDEEGTIAGVAPAQYCYITARFVWLEHLRSPDYSPPAVLGDLKDERAADSDRERNEQQLACLDGCLAQLAPNERDIILGYYAGASGERIAKRRDLAGKLAMTANALTIKASRVRERLRTCVADCVRQS